MTDTLSERTGASEIPLTIGDAVAITRGSLCGLRGTLQAFASGQRCVVTIDGIADGVQIVIGCESVAYSEAASVLVDSHADL